MEIQNITMTMPKFSESNKSHSRNQPPTAKQIQAWIVAYIAELLAIELDEVNVTIPFDHYGLDSAAAVGMTGDLENWIGQKIDPTLLYDYPTIEALSQHLAKEFQVVAV